MSLPDVVQRFKSLTTARYRHGVYELGWAPFPGRLWQRNYHEHIVRNERALSRIRQYIVDNPPRWERDIENPDTQPSPTLKEAAAYYDAIQGNDP
jgi:putative transposase